VQEYTDHNNIDDPIPRIIDHTRHPYEMVLSKDLYTIGRSSSCQIVVIGENVSRLHARIERHGKASILYNMRSSNGTYVNHQLITRPRCLESGDTIGLGRPVEHLRYESDNNNTHVMRRWLDFDEQEQIFRYKQEALVLSCEETRLLSHLYDHEGEICTLEGCIRQVWPTTDPSRRVLLNLERLVGMLRTRLKVPETTHELVEHIPGLGLRLQSFE
jgi:DNA-binding winged helix-turn-helix (wHTH) protein